MSYPEFKKPVEGPCETIEVGDDPGATEMWFGKHMGERFDSLPEGYRRWMLSIYRRESAQDGPSPKVYNISLIMAPRMLTQFPVRQSQSNLQQVDCASRPTHESFIDENGK